MSLSRNEMPACSFNQALGSLSDYHTIVLSVQTDKRRKYVCSIIHIDIWGECAKNKNKKTHLDYISSGWKPLLRIV